VEKCWNVAILTKLPHFGGSCVQPQYQARPNLAANSWPTVYAYTPNFIWIRLLCHLPRTKKNNFGQNLSFGVSYTQPPLPIMAKFGVLEQTHGVHLHAKFRLDDLLCRPLLAKNSNFVFFGLRHFVVSPVNGNLRKLNTGAQPQTFPYPTVSKKFLYSNSFMAKSYAETPSLRWRVESKPHQVWHGDRGPPAHSCTSKRVQAPTYIITTMGCWKLRETRPLSFSKIFSFWDPIALYLHQLKLVLHAKFHPLSATCHPCGAKNLEVTLWVT